MRLAEIKDSGWLGACDRSVNCGYTKKEWSVGHTTQEGFLIVSYTGGQPVYKRKAEKHSNFEEIGSFLLVFCFLFFLRLEVFY